MASVFDTIKQAAGQGNKSINWYRNAVNRLVGKTSAAQLFKQGTLNTRPSVGRLNLFGYDPKLKRTLPYYDVFPLVLPLDTIPGGFMGMNFHYLPPMVRTRLLSRVQQFADDRKLGKNTKFDVNYDDVKSVRIAKPTIKKYLYSHVRTGFLRINADEAATAIFLPVQRFKKASTIKVYADSVRRFI
tara:strand:+ start:1060 stop:1617 length:558 start_codon:yes stop_codon:yes gene_type:complete